MIGSDYLAGDLEADSKEEDELTRQVIMNNVNVGQVSIGGGIVEEEEEEEIEIESNLETIDNLQELASKETRQFELINNNNGLTEENAPTTSKSIIYTRQHTPISKVLCYTIPTLALGYGSAPPSLQ